jgi:ankyrin repeat protein
MLAMILAAALTADPATTTAKRSEVTTTLFVLVNGEGFKDPKKNEALQEILARHPHLDIYETAALGTAAEFEAMLRDFPEAVKRPNSFGWTALHMAAFAGNVANTQLLIDKGADVNVRAKSRFLNTPLQAALLTGQYETAKLLLEHGADPLVRQSKGFTPMHEAALLGRADLIELLLAHGAEINSMADNGHTPLAEAIRGRHDDIATLLKSKGGKIEPTPLDEEARPRSR